MAMAFGFNNNERFVYWNGKKLCVGDLEITPNEAEGVIEADKSLTEIIEKQNKLIESLKADNQMLIDLRKQKSVENKELKQTISELNSKIYDLEEELEEVYADLDNSQEFDIFESSQEVDCEEDTRVDIWYHDGEFYMPIREVVKMLDEEFGEED